MQTRHSRGFFLAALAVVGALAGLPTTGWIVRQQLLMIGAQHCPRFYTLDDSDTALPDPREAAAAAAQRQDFARQRAMAFQQRREFDTNAPVSNSVARALLALQPKFGNRPELQADILRYMTVVDFKIDRDQEEQILLTPQTQAEAAQTIGATPTKSASPTALEVAVETARRGSGLAPDNAYFPTMLALALYAEHRDTAAIAALDEAATKPRWDDYTSGAIRARWSLLHDAYGETGAVSRLVIRATEPFPHYGRIRDAARLTTALAVQRELNGDTSGGFRMRRSLTRIGALMRAQSTFIYGNLTGAAITQIAATRPGGALALAHPTTDTSSAEARAQYVAYLGKIGHPEEAHWYLAETRAAADMRSISRLGAGTADLSETLGLALWWAGGILLLMASLWALILGGFATVLSRTRRMQAGTPLRFRVRLSALLVVALLGGWLAVINSVSENLLGDAAAQVAAIAATVVVLGLLVFPVVRLARGQTVLCFLGEIAKAAGALALCGALAMALLCVTTITCLGIDQTLAGLLNIYTFGDAGSSISWEFCLMTGTTVLAVPLVAMTILAIRSRICRIPLTVGVVRGMRGAALPLAATLLLAYSAVIIQTEHEEIYAQSTLDAAQINEGKYDAKLLHEIWPGSVTVDSKTTRP
jgi:hypothetical protein